MWKPMLAALTLPLLGLAACRTAPQVALAVHEHDRHYEAPTDPAVQAKLEAWQDLRFGLLMHWGAYSQWGIVESWSLCGEDEDWCRRKHEHGGEDYATYRANYEALPGTFDPIGFEPERWAAAAKAAGMGYVVFTTKHHDGFCMFDTRLTDYRITGPDCAFADDPRSDVAAGIFDAFRAEGLWAGAYFSKPDWHSQDYWWSRFPTPDRNVNYDPARYPERWDAFVDFTHGQIEELVTRYGPLDILWLDGGWVQRHDEDELAELRADPRYRHQQVRNQDIRMDELVAMARGHAPGLIVVDRAVPGPHQNYLTPENRVPEEPLPFPWESCIISGGGWSFTPDATYMTTREGVHLLVDIVSKGGNLLLNVAPGPDGRWQQGAYDLLAGYASWMEVNAAAIQGSRARAPYKVGDVCVVDGADGAVYALVLAAEGEQRPPAEVFVPGVTPGDGASVSMLGAEPLLPWVREGDGIRVTLSEHLRAHLPGEHAWCLRIPL